MAKYLIIFILTVLFTGTVLAHAIKKPKPLTPAEQSLYDQEKKTEENLREC
jgi:hypothetical protein